MIGNLAYLDCGTETIELFNCLRVHTYLDRFARNPLRRGCCPDITPWLGGTCPTLENTAIAWNDEDDPTEASFSYSLIEAGASYISPEVDGAWWYSGGRPESAGFWGFEAVRVGGLYQSTTKREFNISTLPCGDLTYGAPQSQGVELVVEGILHGATCCAVAYGYRALMQKLQNCTTGCRGTSLRFLSTLPATTPLSCEGIGEDGLPAELTTPWRTLHNVSMVEYPSVQGKEGMSCGTCGCAPLTWVRFVLRSNPGLFLDPVLSLATAVPHGEDCVVFCEEPCVNVEPFPDPICPVPILPEPPRALSSCYCPPVAMNRGCFLTETTDTPFDFQLSIRLLAGAIKALRNLRVRMWVIQAGHPTYDPAFYTYCNADVDIGVSYVPANGTWELLPGRGAFITVGGVTAPARQSLFTGLGQPRPPCVKVPQGDYILCIDSDILNTGSDASISVYLVEVEPT